MTDFIPERFKSLKFTVLNDIYIYNNNENISFDSIYMALGSLRKSKSIKILIIYTLDPAD